MIQCSLQLSDRGTQNNLSNSPSPGQCASASTASAGLGGSCVTHGAAASSSRVDLPPAAGASGLSETWSIFVSLLHQVRGRYILPQALGDRHRYRHHYRHHYRHCSHRQHDYRNLGHWHNHRRDQRMLDDFARALCDLWHGACNLHRLSLRELVCPSGCITLALTSPIHVPNLMILIIAISLAEAETL